MTTEHIHNWNDTCDLEIIGNIFDNPELLEDCAIAKKMRDEGSN